MLISEEREDLTLLPLPPYYQFNPLDGQVPVIKRKASDTVIFPPRRAQALERKRAVTPAIAGPPALACSAALFPGWFQEVPWQPTGGQAAFGGLQACCVLSWTLTRSRACTHTREEEQHICLPSPASLHTRAPLLPLLRLLFLSVCISVEVVRGPRVAKESFLGCGWGGKHKPQKDYRRIL